MISHESQRRPNEADGTSRGLLLRNAGGVLIRDIRLALRTLRKQRSLTAMVVAMMALGIASNAVVFTILDAVVLSDLPYRDPDRLVAISTSRDGETAQDEISVAAVAEWMARSRTVESFAMWNDGGGMRLTLDGRTELVRGMRVSANYFDLLGVPMQLGRGLAASDETAAGRNAAVLTDGAWRALFGADPEVVGRVVATLDGAFRVIGVLPADFHPPHMSNPGEFPRIYAPLGMDRVAADCRPCPDVRVIARTRHSVSAAAAPVALVSESAARTLFRGDNPIGRHVQIGDRDAQRAWATIVGVVGDVHQYGLDAAARPAAYLPFAQAPHVQGWSSLVVRARVDPERIERAVRAALLEVDPLQPLFHVQSMDEYVAKSVAQRTFTFALVAVCGALAFLLATIGVYGVVSYVTAMRGREAAIRIALDAAPAAIVRAFAGEVATLAAVGVAAGVAVVAAATPAISGLLFEVDARDPRTLGAAAALVLTSAIAAASLPAWRTARRDPLAALRRD